MTLGSKLQQQNVIKTKSVKLFLSTWTKVQMNQAVSPKIDFAAVLLIKNVRGWRTSKKDVPTLPILPWTTYFWTRQSLPSDFSDLINFSWFFLWIILNLFLRLNLSNPNRNFVNKSKQSQFKNDFATTCFLDFC